jgi:hypothetical protein
MVRSALKDQGLTLISINPRKTVPAELAYKTDPGYSDNWDEWLLATYSGPAKDVNIKRRWAWLMHADSKAAAANHPDDAPTTIEHSVVIPSLVIGVTALGALAILKRRM